MEPCCPRLYGCEPGLRWQRPGAFHRMVLEWQKQRREGKVPAVFTSRSTSLSALLLGAF